MPLTDSGRKVLKNMQKEYGEKKGKSVFYASINKGKPGSEKWHESKLQSEEFPMTKVKEFRNFINKQVEVVEDMAELKADLRSDIEEVTISAGIEVGPPKGPVPAGQDFKKDKLPGEKEKAKHKVSDKEVEGIKDTPNSERTGHTGMQAGNAKKTPIGEEDEQALEAIYEMTDEEFEDFYEELDDKEKDYVDALLESQEELTDEELLSAITEMSDEEYDEFVEGLDNQEREELEDLLTEGGKIKALKFGVPRVLKTLGKGARQAVHQLKYGLKGQKLKTAAQAIKKATKTAGAKARLTKLRMLKADYTPKELCTAINEMSEEEYNDFIDSLNKQEFQYLESIFNEQEEVLPDEIDASDPPAVGSEDAHDGMRSVDKDLDTPQKKKHTAKQVNILPDAENDE